MGSVHADFNKQLLLDIHAPFVPTLDNFLPGRNVELLQLLKNVLLQQEKERFIYLWGNPGCGKSHLLQAMITEFAATGQNAVFFSADKQHDFLTSNDIDCVAIDDIDALNTSGQAELFKLYNQLRDESEAIFLVSGSAAPKYLDMRQDLVTRMGWGLVYQVHDLNEEEKIHALKKHAANSGFNLSQDVCLYLLRHGRRDLSSLMMIIDALDRYSLANQRHITVPLLRELLQVSS
ncbi:MAG: DnaA regulatory inactivator Hda [Nitrosomonas sp.]